MNNIPQVYKDIIEIDNKLEVLTQSKVIDIDVAHDIRALRKRRNILTWSISSPTGIGFV